MLWLWAVKAQGLLVCLVAEEALVSVRARALVAEQVSVLCRMDFRKTGFQIV